MAEIPDRRDSIGETGDNTGTPRWVYVFGIIAIVVAVVFVILHLAGGGFRSH